ncbi:MAG: hypothetical protein PHS04_11650 [Tissierellia bacterium]|nr:hypothetical protein [Tissierellia bacterium]
MTFPEIFITEISSVLFIESIEGKFNKVLVAADIVDNFNYFDNEQVILPIPDDAPGEIPRIVLKGSEYQCQISLKQLILINNSSTLILSNAEALIVNLKKIIEIVTNKPGMRFSRIGFVVKGYLEAEPFGYIREYYIKDKIINCNGYDLGFLFKPEMEEIKFNKWVKFTSEKERVNFIIDYNTVNDLNSEFSVITLNGILDYINNEFKNDNIALFQTGVITEA